MAPRIHIEVGDAFATDPFPTAVWDAARWDTPGAHWSGILPNFTPIDCRVRGVSIRRGRDGPLDVFTPGTATVTVANDDGWATWSPAAPGPLTEGSWCRVLADAIPLFTGLVQRIVDSYLPGARPGADLVLVEPTARFGEVELIEQAPAGAGDTVDERLGRLCDLVGWPHQLCDFDPGGPALTAATLGGNAHDLAQRAAVTGGGAFFADAGGVNCYRGGDWLRTDPRATTPQVVITSGPKIPPPEPPRPVPVNLLTNVQQATIETGSTVPALGAAWWVGANNASTRMARTTDHAREGASSIFLNNIAGVGGLIAFASTVENGTSPTAQRRTYPVVAGRAYTFFGSVWAPPAGNYGFVIEWFAGATSLGTVGAHVAPPVRGAWFDAPGVFAVAPATADGARLRYSTTNQAAGATFYFDRFLFAEGRWTPDDWVPPGYVPPVPEPWTPQMCATAMTVFGPDRERVLNVATFTGVDEGDPEAEPVDVTRSDPASVARFGQRTFPVGELYSTDPAWLGVLAGRVVGLRRSPAPHLDAVELSPVADPDAYPFAAQVAYGDRITTHYRDPNGWSWQFDSHVHGITHDITPSGDDNQAQAWTVGLTLDDATWWTPGDAWDWSRWDAARWSAAGLRKESAWA